MNLLLGVTGSVAAYRAADLARELMREGWTVRACLSDAAQRFVTPALFEALTGQPCLQDVFDEPVRGRMAHIDWAREADLIVIVPASANTLVKLAYGLGDDMLTTLVLAATRPVVVAPAMNPTMLADPRTQEALMRLETWTTVVEPAEGEMACGEMGQGKLASVEQIVEVVRRIRSVRRVLEGRTLLLTSGPTHEPIDDVRFVGNRSSGRMGAAIARAAVQMGARVMVVSGPVRVRYPAESTVVPVRTAEEMLSACRSALGDADIVVGAAAVADYRPEHSQRGKLRRENDAIDLRLVRNPDILATLAREAGTPRPFFVGFAAEPEDGLEYARRKLAAKGIDAIAVNDVSRSDIGFEATTNELTWLTATGEAETSGYRSKDACAVWLLERIAGELAIR